MGFRKIAKTIKHPGPGFDRLLPREGIHLAMPPSTAGAGAGVQPAATRPSRRLWKNWPNGRACFAGR